MGAKTDKGNAMQAVVEQYMAAVENDNRCEADQLLATLHVGYPHYGEKRDLRAGSSGFDWFRYFRDQGYVLSTTTLLEDSGLWAIVEARCSIPSGPHQGSRQTIIFRLFRETSAWLISDISLNLDADVRGGDQS